MRSLVVLSLAASLSLAAGAVQAQSGTWGNYSKRPPPTQVTGGKFEPLPGSGPYKPHAAPAAPKAIGSTDGGEGFKPYKPFSPGSVYSDPYKKPAKPKSTYGY